MARQNFLILLIIQAKLTADLIKGPFTNPAPDKKILHKYEAHEGKPIAVFSRLGFTASHL